jgi:hypothetical protein
MIRISVTQLRVLFLVVNLVLAGSLVYKALAAYSVLDIVFGEGAVVEKHPPRVDLSSFVYVPENFGKPSDPASAVLRVSSDLQPPKPALPATDAAQPAAETAETEDAPSAEEELPEGPLGKDWEYVYYIAWHESGARNFAQLRKKQDDKGRQSSRISRSSSAASAARASSTRTRTTATTAKTYTRGAAKKDTLSFLVSDREIQNEEFELHFWVHSADQERLVYWMPGQPSKFYALPYQHEGSYLAQGPIRKELRPADGDEEEGETDEQKKSFYVIQEDADPESAREKRYAEILSGKTPETKFSPSSGTRSRSGGEPESPGPSPSPGSGGRGPSKPTKEDIKALKSAIDKIPKAEQERLKSELQGMLQGKSK